MKILQQKHKDSLPPGDQQLEMLQDFEEWAVGTPPIILNIPGIGAKDEHTEAELKALTLEALDRDYHPSTWTRVYTDGSAENAVRNGGGGVHIKFPDGRRISKSIPTGRFSTNYRAEACALLLAAQILNTTENLPDHTVFLVDCQSLLQSLQNNERYQILQDIRQELHTLCSRTTLALQWIPSHCDILGNEEADRLSKVGSKQQQTLHPMSYGEMKAILRSNSKLTWRARLHAQPEQDPIHQLDRAQQVTIFRLRTGHCQLLAHLYRLKVSPTDDCPCGTGPQTPAHILQSCPTFDTLRREAWPCVVDLDEKLWGVAGSQRRTADFAMKTGLTI